MQKQQEGGINAETAGSQHLISASRDKTVKLWDIETGFCDHTISDHHDWVRCIAVRPHDGGLFASAGNDTVIQVYDASTRNKVAELRGHEHVIESIAFVTEEVASKKKESKHLETVRDYLASGGRDRTVRLWKISTVECLAVFKQHENWVRSVLIHPSGNYVISAGDDRSIRVYDIKVRSVLFVQNMVDQSSCHVLTLPCYCPLQANRCLRTLDGAHGHFVTSLAMHHTLPILVSGGVDQTVKCWMLD